MKKSKILITTLVSIVAAGNIVAATSLSKADKAQIMSKISHMKFIQNAALKLKKIKRIGDTYAIEASNPRAPKILLFVSKDLKVVTIGAGFTADGKKIDFPIDMSKAIGKELYTVGNGKKDYYVFTDPECPYCQQFERKLDKLDKNAKLHVYLFPLNFHKHARSMTKYIMSQKTNAAKAKAIEDIAKGDKSYAKAKYSDEENKKYEAMINDSIKLGNLMGVRGTPTVYDAKGQNVPWPNLVNRK
ncbi:thioredoxin fold domain-containing protein [Sulfurimonas sp.]